MNKKAYAIPYKNFMIIFGAALMVRLIFLFQFQSNLLFENYIVDMLFYHQQALAITHGESLIEGPFFRAPFYSYFIAGIYYIFGESNWIFRIIQIFLGSLSCGILFLVGNSVFSNRIGLISGLIMALCGPLIFYDVMLLATTLAIFLNLLALWQFIKYLESQKPLDLIIAGLAIGLSAITRPNILFFAMALLIWALIAILRKKQFVSLKHLIFLALAIIIPLAPVTAHNYNKSGEFILIGAYGGINLYIGNYNQADGVSAVIPGVRKDWWGGFEDTKRIAETEAGKNLTASEVSDFWYDKTIDEVTDNPGRFAGLLFKKMMLLTSGIELSNNFDYYYFTRQSWLTKLLIWPKFIFFPWGLIFPLALIGFLSVKKYNTKSKTLLLFIVMYGISIVLFLVSTRYRLPLLPILILMAVFWIDKFITSFKSYSTSEKLFSIIVPLIFIVISNYDYYSYGQVNSAHGYHTTASIYNQQRKISLAESYYKKALAADSNLSETINDYGMLLAGTDRPVAAFNMLLDGHQKFPDDPTINYNLGYLYLLTGQVEYALPYFKQSLIIIPDNLNTLNNLGLTFLRLNQFDSAALYFKRVILIEPRFENAYYNLALLEKSRDHFELALDYYYRIKSIQPQNFTTDYLLGLTYLEFGNYDSATVRLKNVVANMPPQSDEVRRSLYLLDSLNLK